VTVIRRPAVRRGIVMGQCAKAAVAAYQATAPATTANQPPIFAMVPLSANAATARSTRETKSSPYMPWPSMSPPAKVSDSATRANRSRKSPAALPEAAWAPDRPAQVNHRAPSAAKAVPPAVSRSRKAIRPATNRATPPTYRASDAVSDAVTSLSTPV
jgi:hypothetical protein